MGCGVPAGIYAHICAQNEPALKYPPLGSHWTCPSIWHMSHLHSPVFHTASTDHTQPSLHRLWQASPHFSLLTEIPSVSLVQTASQESMASNPTSVYHTPLFSGQSPQVLVSDAYVSVSSVSFTPALPSGLSSTHQVLPFLQVCKLMGRLVPIHA